LEKIEGIQLQTDIFNKNSFLSENTLPTL